MGYRLIGMMLLAFGLHWGLGVAHAQPAKKVFRIGNLTAGFAPFTAPVYAAFVQGLQLHALELRNPPYDFDRAMVAAVQAQAQALVVLSSPLFYAHRKQIAALTIKYRLPTIFLFSFYVDLGGLMSYGVNMPDMFRSVTTYVDQIFKGAQPSNIPVEQPTKFELVINQKTAQQIGVTIPPLVLFQANKVIQ